MASAFAAPVHAASSNACMGAGKCGSARRQAQPRKIAIVARWPRYLHKPHSVHGGPLVLDVAQVAAHQVTPHKCGQHILPQRRRVGGARQQRIHQPFGGHFVKVGWRRIACTVAQCWQSISRW